MKRDFLQKFSPGGIQKLCATEYLSYLVDFVHTSFHVKYYFKVVNVSKLNSSSRRNTIAAGESFERAFMNLFVVQNIVTKINHFEISNGNSYGLIIHF